MTDLDTASNKLDKPVSQRFDLYNILFKRVPALYRRADAVLHLTVLGILLASIVILIFNHFTHDYTTLNVSAALVTAIPGVFVVWVLGTLMYPKRPRLGLFLSSLAQMYFFIIVIVMALAAAITTPFAVIDAHLLKFDQFFGFSTLKLMSWAYHYPWLSHGLKEAYDSWFFELALTPLFLALLNDRVEIDRFIIATFIAFLIAGGIYYFWPTIAPAGVLSSSYFMQSQHDLVQRFYEVHHHLRLTVFDGGIIAFPSCHVINSLIVLYAWRRYRWVFYPLLIINICSIFATMALGYHYLADVLAGFLFAYISVKLATLLLIKYSKKPNLYT